MSNEVTKRLIRCHHVLINSGAVKSSSAFAREIGTQRQSFNKITKGDREATVDMITKAIEVYNLNPSYLFQGLEPMFLSNAENRMNIAFVDGNVFAGGDEQFGELVLSQDVEYFRMPGLLSDVDYRCYNVEGDSMEPTFDRGDKVICSQVNNLYWEQLLKDNHVYIIVTALNDVFIKRIKNNIRKNATLELISDNEEYATREIDISDLRALWKVEYRLTSNFSTKYISTLKKEINNLHSSIADLRESVDQIKTQSL